MIKFIIVEDNKFNRDDVERLIMNYMLTTNYKFDIVKYDKICDGIYEKCENCYEKHVFLLDYYLPNGTAVDIARKIREDDWDSPIVIFTADGDDNVILKTYKERLQILDFIVKDENYQSNLLELFGLCLAQLNYSEKFSYKNSFMSYNFDYDKIQYIYKLNNERRIMVVTDNGRYPLTTTLQKFYGHLTNNYVYTHKSCIVNMARVKLYDWKNNKFVLDSGEEVYMLSRLRRKELMERGNR